MHPNYTLHDTMKWLRMIAIELYQHFDRLDLIIEHIISIQFILYHESAIISTAFFVVFFYQKEIKMQQAKQNSVCTNNGCLTHANYWISYGSWDS